MALLLILTLSGCDGLFSPEDTPGAVAHVDLVWSISRTYAGGELRKHSATASQTVVGVDEDDPPVGGFGGVFGGCWINGIIGTGTSGGGGSRYRYDLHWGWESSWGWFELDSVLASPGGANTISLLAEAPYMQIEETISTPQLGAVVEGGGRGMIVRFGDTIRLRVDRPDSSYSQEQIDSTTLTLDLISINGDSVVGTSGSVGKVAGTVVFSSRELFTKAGVRLRQGRYFLRLTRTLYRSHAYRPERFYTITSSTVDQFDIDLLP